MTIGRGWAVALGLLLVASLAVNVFIGGLIAGARMSRLPAVEATQWENRALWSRLSTQDRAIAREVIRDRIRLARGMAADYRRAMGEVERSLRTEPFDADRLRAALDRVRAMNEERAHAEFEGLVEAARRFSPEGRALIAEMRRPGLRGLLPPSGEGERRAPPERDARPAPPPL
jgi:uncharacterized membrane protein